MKIYATKPQHFLWILFLLCTFYLVCEWFLNHYAMLSVDEFWFAHRIYQYKDGIPYRDFSPYKTVFGYYLLLIPMMLHSSEPMQMLIFMKNSIAVVNTIILFFSALWMKKFFMPSAILASLALLVSAEIVLSCSSNIRVDLLGYWFCFFSLLFILENRFALAGFLLGLGFITTQKALWYLCASDCALAIHCILFSRNLQTVKNIIRFNFFACLVVLSYIVFWTCLTDWQTVIHNVFYEAVIMYQLDWYASARKLFWAWIIAFNPLLIFLWPLTLISVLVTFQGDHNYRRRVFIVAYALVILCCLIPYKQIFPYYLQVAMPILLVLYSAFFSWFFTIFKKEQALKIIIGKKGLWVTILAYISGIMSCYVIFDLPDAYLLFCIIPILLGAYIIHYDSIQKQLIPIVYNMIIISFIFIGGIYPLTLYMFRILDVNGDYQKANINVMNALLQQGGDYVAGIELIYNKTQPIAGMRHLMGPAVDYLYFPSPKLRPAMLASLYEDPKATAESVIQDFKKSAVKFYVNNYRMEILPENIKSYLNTEYEHYWGSIYIYAPEIPAGRQKITMKFTGNYLLETKHKNKILLNGKAQRSGSIIHLMKGKLISNAKHAYRLKLLPDVTVDERFQEDDWRRMLS